MKVTFIAAFVSRQGVTYRGSSFSTIAAAVSRWEVTYGVLPFLPVAATVIFQVCCEGHFGAILAHVSYSGLFGGRACGKS